MTGASDTIVRMATSSPLSRSARAWRGGAAALFATVCAAASHSLAGGEVTWLALLATTVVALPLCVALSGTLGSGWRVSVAVLSSQALFHWSFAGLGSLTSQAAGAGTPASPHAGHTLSLSLPVPFLPHAENGAEGMWLAHLMAAILTITLLCYGERAAIALSIAFRRRVYPVLTTPLVFTTSAIRPQSGTTVSPVGRFTGINSITHRGPPRAASTTTHYACTAA